MRLLGEYLEPPDLEEQAGVAFLSGARVVMSGTEDKGAEQGSPDSAKGESDYEDNP